MIDADRLDKVKAMINGETVELNPLSALSHTELRKMRDEIVKLLPDDKLETLNLEQELVSQYRKTKDLMDDVLSDEGVQANQKAQVANSVVSTLGQLVKMQEDLKRQETLKIMESCMIEVMKMQPDEVRNLFFSEYERLATKAGLMQ
jgi:hypothetical protein